MSHASTITAGVYSKVIAFLAPLFLDTAFGDPQAARLTATATLDSHKPRNDTELRLAALIMAFSLGALDALSRAANPDLTDNQVLRLRGNANALGRAAAQNQKLLDLLRAEAPPADQPVPQDMPESAAMPDLVAYARSAGSPLSRQQRRAAERQAEKMRKRQEASARLAQRSAVRGPPQHAAA
jgi:hypothetical protein